MDSSSVCLHFSDVTLDSVATSDRCHQTVEDVYCSRLRVCAFQFDELQDFQAINFVCISSFDINI